MMLSSTDPSSEHKKGRLISTSRLCVISLFMFLQELNVNESLYSALYREAGIEISFSQIGRELGALIDTHINKTKHFFKSTKQHQTLYRIRACLLCRESQKKIILESDMAKKRLSSVYKIIKYLVLYGKPIQEGFSEYCMLKQTSAMHESCTHNTLQQKPFMFQKTHINCSSLPNSAPFRPAKISVNKNTIWFEMVKRKNMPHHTESFLLKCKERADKRLNKTKVLTNSYLKKDTEQSYENITAQYYVFLNKQTSFPFTFLDGLTDLCKNSSNNSYFYNFKVNKK
ncbi:hypothetical protein NEPAR06_0900 [Nematocida parisii]|uniref:Uncharacterized protein n=1 Tax=Nematocida parisii (strain ERTm3) TaxID=935791 RepID=I3EDU8_NEMP3|nr:hypothetical protein NEQG_02518 [Nematocida parisii ERTm3]KAI5127549.1 hypothetical protein NEPAR08_0919 [Nematocida parisii]KAI5127824.1 hypothetical protein NEPAR03_1104 [Nematocida parisii]KAI5141660.1 hypothetical protein NEPAR04_1137 [Nematocida parisii]KAI5145499.1 hypothetical protein NEPAR07_1729 [Nematocida parisii]